jgi:hypothetical protein
MDNSVRNLATPAGIMKINAPDFTGMFVRAIKAGGQLIYEKLPYQETGVYKYTLYGIGGAILLYLIFWYWKNFIR